MSEVLNLEKNLNAVCGSRVKLLMKIMATGLIYELDFLEKASDLIKEATGTDPDFAKYKFKAMVGLGSGFLLSWVALAESIGSEEADLRMIAFNVSIALILYSRYVITSFLKNCRDVLQDYCLVNYKFEPKVSTLHMWRAGATSLFTLANAVVKQKARIDALMGSK